MSEDSILQLRLSFYNEDTIYGNEVFFVKTDLDDTGVEALRYDLASQSRYDDDRIPDRVIVMEIEDLDDLPVGVTLTDLDSLTPEKDSNSHGI